MEVSHSNPVPLTGQLLKTAVQAWRIGQTLQAVTLADSRQGQVDLRIGNKVITAATPQPLKEGVALTLRVKSVDGQAVLQVSQATAPPDPVRSAIRRLLPKQTPLKPVFERLLTLAPRQSADDTPPPRTDTRIPARPDLHAGQQTAAPRQSSPAAADRPVRVTEGDRAPDRLPAARPQGGPDLSPAWAGDREVLNIRPAGRAGYATGPSFRPVESGETLPPTGMAGKPRPTTGTTPTAPADTDRIRALLAQLPDREGLNTMTTLRASIDRALAVLTDPATPARQKTGLDVLVRVLKDVGTRLPAPAHDRRFTAALPAPGKPLLAAIERILNQPLPPAVTNDAGKTLDGLRQQLQSLLPPAKDQAGKPPTPAGGDVPPPYASRSRSSAVTSPPTPETERNRPADDSRPAPARRERPADKHGDVTDPGDKPLNPSQARPGVKGSDQLHVRNLLGFLSAVRQQWAGAAASGQSNATPARTPATPETPSPRLPGNLVQPLADVLSRLPDKQQLGSADGLRRALFDSGLFLEARLAAGEAEILRQSDLKAGLLRLLAPLRDVTTTRTADPTPAPAAAPTGATALSPGVLQWARTMLREVEGAISRIQLNQVQSRAQDSTQSQVWVFELPVKLDRTVDSLKIRFEQEPRSSQAPTEAPWHVEVDFDFENLGRIQARINIRGDTVSTQFRSDNPEAVHAFRSHLDILRSRLSLMGLNVDRLSVRQGEAPSGVERFGLDGLLSEKA